MPGTPLGYHLGRDADVPVVRRPDGSAVAAFGARYADSSVREDAD